MMTILFEKKYAALNGDAVFDFAALCAASGGSFGQELKILARKIPSSVTVSPTVVAVLAIRAWTAAWPRPCEEEGDEPEGFMIGEGGIAHADVHLAWRMRGVTLRILTDSEEVSRHAWAAWQEALGLPQYRDTPLERAATMATTAVGGRNWSARWCALESWPVSRSLPAAKLDEIQEAQCAHWARSDMAWRARMAGLLEGEAPQKPDLPAEAAAWAKAYAEAEAAERASRRSPAKRVVVRRKPDETPPTPTPWTS
jgi:hypothetical protein